jgi:hypothetical protein
MLRFVTLIINNIKDTKRMSALKIAFKVHTHVPLVYIICIFLLVCNLM